MNILFALVFFPVSGQVILKMLFDVRKKDILEMKIWTRDSKNK